VCCEPHFDATCARVHADGGVVTASITPVRPCDVPIDRRRCHGCREGFVQRAFTGMRGSLRWLALLAVALARRT